MNKPLIQKISQLRVIYIPIYILKTLGGLAWYLITKPKGIGYLAVGIAVVSHLTPTLVKQYIYSPVVAAIRRFLKLIGFAEKERAP